MVEGKERASGEGFPYTVASVGPTPCTVASGSDWPLSRIMTTIVLSCISAGGEGRGGRGFYEMQRDAANIELLIYGWIIRKGYCSIHGQLAE